MDPIEMLIDGAVQNQVLQSRNPYLTMETIVLRLYKKISEHTRVQFHQNDKTVLFSQWHDEILDAYEILKSKMSHEERTSVERVLSKDCPHPTELTKFACSWYKYDPIGACRLFAVDGIVGTHPRAYVQEAFSTNFENHNAAVRSLYSYFQDVEMIKRIVSKAIGLESEEDSVSDPDVDRCVGLYSDMVVEEEAKSVAEDRRSKLQAQQQPNKRKKKVNRAATPPVQQPPSPVDSPPQNLQ